jgi:hypothetical protein
MRTRHADDDRLCLSAMAGTFPGAESPDALWSRILRAQVAPATRMSRRWGIPAEAIVAPEPGMPNRTYLDLGFCLAPGAPGGAHAPGGHQLRVTRAVLERLAAGPARDRASVGLVLGTSWSDESYFMADPDGGPRLDPAAQVRELARAAGLGGPAFAVDTACSSFHYALDAAGTLIRTSQAEAVVVAGVNAFLPPALYLGFSQLRALAATGALLSFGAGACGIVPGEAVAAFLLEPVDRAMRAGRTPLGVVAGLGLSSDGAEGSVFAPGRQAQLVAYARAYDSVDPATVDYLEAHGTGTPLGDATEVESLDAFFREHVPSGRRLPVGSIKPIIGHTLAAAGAASLAKALLMLRHRTLPPHVALEPHPRLRDSCLTLLDAPAARDPGDRPMRIGISSFGFGGANAHVVVEEPRPAPARARPRPAPSGVTRTDLAVVDVEAAFGGAHSAHAWRRALGAPAAARAFPAGRFTAPDAAPLPPARGMFLRGAATIDIAGFRMGPRPLARVDAFKLLVAHRAGTLLRRHPAAARTAGTAVVVTANTGGERFSDVYRGLERFHRGEGRAPCLTAEDVATMLPTMVSGYPASFLDLRGFHETLSGGPGTFWASLLAAPAWLDARCRTLLLGAGHYLSCPSDVEDAARPGRAPRGEGVGLLALKSVHSARADGDRVLATIHCIVRAPHARTLDDACAAAGVPSDGLRVERCDLDADAAHEPGSAQAATGFLREATGIESVLAALLRGGRSAVVEVRRAARPELWVFIDNEADEAEVPADPAPKLPFTIAFSPDPADDAAPRTAVAVARPAAPPEAATAIVDAYAAVGRALAASLRTRADALCRLRALGGAPASAAPRPLEELLAAQQSDPRNVVLEQPTEADGAFQATLRVDEGHGYFFDHPLDHVPGILLLHGAVALATLAAARLRPGRPGLYVRAVDVRFRRYTEKAPPITLSARPVPSAGPALAVAVRVEQSGQVTCECRVEVDEAAAIAPYDPPAAFPPGADRPDRHLLHKSRDENVLVGPLEEHAGGLRVRTLPVPPGHFFADGDPRQHSMLYFLEIARQCFMLVAHTAVGVPLGVPMNLVALTFALAAPIPRGAPLELVPQVAADRWTGVMKTGRVGMALSGPAGPLGTVEIVAQVISKELYELQRHAAP